MVMPNLSITLFTTLVTILSSSIALSVDFFIVVSAFAAAALIVFVAFVTPLALPFAIALARLTCAAKKAESPLR